MRLINTTTLRFQEFFDAQRPPYATLSHTWGSEEVSYLDFLFLTSDLPANALGAVQVLLRNPNRKSAGYRKVEASCRVAQSRGYEWIWVDSCCIDKSSSAELSEAINSMWQWYCNAAECYAYLSDISIAANQLQSQGHVAEALKTARWFTRGWTLQELLAPKTVIFYDSEWQLLAEKEQIAPALSEITGIPQKYLRRIHDAHDCKVCSVAMKMCWVSRRQTTRVEDMAYCMLGLFDVHMPLIYGEGRKAFMRLQLEIFKKIDDDSIYAWREDKDSSGLLATWPTAFADSGNVVQIAFPEEQTPWLPPVMTSIGLEMRGRYRRLDPAQQALDDQYGVRSISTSLATHDRTSMAMHCSPLIRGQRPVTQYWTRSHTGKALIIVLQRSGASWQRVNCRRLDFVEYGMYESPGVDAYQIYYVPQEGV